MSCAREKEGRKRRKEKETQAEIKEYKKQNEEERERKWRDKKRQRKMTILLETSANRRLCGWEVQEFILLVFSSKKQMIRCRLIGGREGTTTTI